VSDSAFWEFQLTFHYAAQLTSPRHQLKSILTVDAAPVSFGSRPEIYKPMEVSRRRGENAKCKSHFAMNRLGDLEFNGRGEVVEGKAMETRFETIKWQIFPQIPKSSRQLSVFTIDTKVFHSRMGSEKAAASQRRGKVV
jgi:hypothetical protein